MRKSDQVTNETSKTQTSRRNLLKGAAAGAAGVTGLAVAGGTLLSQFTGVHAAAAYDPNCVTPIAEILTIARTAERLAVTFYTNGLKHADRAWHLWR